MSEDIEVQKGAVDKKFVESNAGDGTTVYQQQLHGIRLYTTFAACFITLFLIGLDQTIVLTILVDVGSLFNAYDKIGWISSSYMLTLAVFAATWGKASIIFGRKYSALVAIALFEAGSLVCALSNNVNTLIGGRVLAGIGGAGIQNVVFIICSESVQISKRPLVFAALGVAFACSSVSGPLIGGALTQHVTWRWCFYINLPLGGVAALAFIFFFNPPKPKGTWKEKILALDYIAVGLLSCGLVLFLLGLTFGGQEFPWKSAAVICLFIFGGLILIAFCVWNFKYSTAPIIPYEIIVVLGCTIPSLVLFFTFFCFMGLSIYFTTYFQIIKNNSAFDTGVHLLALIVPVILSSISTGILMRKTRLIKPYAVFAAFLGCIGTGCLTLWEVDSNLSLQIGLLILPGLSVGCLLQTTMFASQVNAPKSPGSTILATTLLNFTRALGGTIGGDLSQVVFNSSIRTQLEKSTSAILSYGYTIDEMITLVNSPSVIQSLDPDLKNILLNSIMSSIKNVFYTSTGVGCLMFILVIFFPNKKVPRDDEVLTKEEYEEQQKKSLEIGNINDADADVEIKLQESGTSNEGIQAKDNEFLNEEDSASSKK